MVFFSFIKEVVPQFFSTLIVFCSIIVISQLVRLSEVLVAFGLSAENVLLPFLYIILPFMTVVIPISFFFAVMVAFSRMSSDGELTAYLAAGMSMKKMAAPILLIGVILYGVAATSGMYLEAWGRREFIQFQYRKTQTELDNIIKFRMQEGVFLNDFIGYVIYAEKISDSRDQFENIMLAPGKRKENNFFILAPNAEIIGSVEEANLRMVFYNGKTTSSNTTGSNISTIAFDRAEIDLLNVFQKQIFGDDYKGDDYRSYPPIELIKYIDQMADNEEERGNYLKSRYLLHFRLSNAFAIIGFGFFAMVLGFQGQRHNKNLGYVGTIITIIFSYVITMGGKWLAEHDHLAAPIAAWMPHFLMLSIGILLLYQKNRLPIGESPFAYENLPLIGRKHE